MLEVTEKCSFKAILVEENREVQFNINVAATNSDIQRSIVGKKVGDTFYIPVAKCTYNITHIFPYNPTNTYNHTNSSIKQKGIQIGKLELIKKLKFYGFKGFVHTTEIDNFKSIIKSGFLFSRNTLKNNNVKFVDKAIKDIINNTSYFIKSCCRFYYAEGTPTNYRANYTQPVILIFSDALIEDFEDKIYFTHKNAACSDVEITSSLRDAYNFDWEGIFERGYYSKSKFYNKETGISPNDHIKQIRNAEFLVKDNVPISYIKEIIVFNEEDYARINTFCDKSIMKKVIIKGESQYDTVF